MAILCHQNFGLFSIWATILILGVSSAAGGISCSAEFPWFMSVFIHLTVRNICCFKKVRKEHSTTNYKVKSVKLIYHIETFTLFLVLLKQLYYFLLFSVIPLASKKINK